MYLAVTNKQCCGSDILFCIQGLDCFIADICDVGLNWADHNRDSLMQFAFMFTVFFFTNLYAIRVFSLKLVLKTLKAVVYACCFGTQYSPLRPPLLSFLQNLMSTAVCCLTRLEGWDFHYIHMPNRSYKMHSCRLKLYAHVWLHIHWILHWCKSTVGHRSMRPLF